MSLFGKSLDAVTSTGAGTEFMFDVPHSQFTFLVSSTGAPDSFFIVFEGTLGDGVWFTMSAAGIDAPQTGSKYAVGPWPVIGVRANLTALSGGTSPTITASFGAV